jgi:hypothetical protein
VQQGIFFKTVVSPTTILIQPGFYRDFWVAEREWTVQEQGILVPKQGNFGEITGNGYFCGSPPVRQQRAISGAYSRAKKGPAAMRSRSDVTQV